MNCNFGFSNATKPPSNSQRLVTLENQVVELLKRIEVLERNVNAMDVDNNHREYIFNTHPSPFTSWTQSKSNNFPSTFPYG